MRKNTIRSQTTTGKTTESLVQGEIISLGLEAVKPVPDRGIDLVVCDSDDTGRKVYIQIKGRGKTQKNKKYRWFQLRTTKKQRELAVRDGLDVSAAWEKKLDKCDFFILVSLRYNEHWIFPKEIIREIIGINKMKYGNRADNVDGRQVEIDLDIVYEGKTLTDRYRSYCGNYLLIRSRLSA